jgi:DNA-binding SARP family transcriptional activator
VLLRVLGPLEVSGPDGPVALGGAKPRTVLAALALHRTQAVDVDLLIDALWGEDPPASASKLIQVYVSQLRKALPEGIAIATTPAGYRLDVDPAETDVVRFEQLLGDGRAALAAGNPAKLLTRCPRRQICQRPRQGEAASTGTNHRENRFGPILVP